MGAGTVEPERDHVTFFDERDQLDVGVREPSAHVAQHDPDESGRAMHVPQRAMRDEALVDDSPHGGFITGIDGGDQRLHNCFVRHDVQRPVHG